MEIKDYEILHGFYLEELKIGQTAIMSKTVTESDILSFAGVSGDNNPVHISEEFASKTIFRKRVAHGFLTASFISSVIGTKLPGPGSIYVKQILEFLSPIYVGETVTIKVTVNNINLKKRRVTLKTICEKNGKKILDGEAEILVESKNKWNL